MTGIVRPLRVMSRRLIKHGFRYSSFEKPKGVPALAVLFSVLYLLAGMSAHGGSVILQPSADTSLFEAFPNSNLGANENMVAGANANLLRARGVFRFDISGSIPSNAIIESVSLTLTVVIVPPDGGQPSTFDLRRLFADWGEGTGTNNAGTAANPGEATWNARFYPSTLWSFPGGSVSNDFSAVVSGSLFLAELGTYTFASTSNLVSDVQTWLRNSATNFGWILISESEDFAFSIRRIGTRESTNSPLLSVDFTLPTAPTLQLTKTPAEEIQLAFLASPGQPYSVQFRDSLSFGNWLTLTNLPPQSTWTNIVVTDPSATNKCRFYRVAAL